MIKKISKVLIYTIISIVLILFLSNINTLAAGFADYDDETADAQATEQLKEQEEQDNKNMNKATNNYLKQLSIEGYELSPEFDKQIINYSVDTEVTAESVRVSALADDSRATVSGTGEIVLQSGENEIKIDVKAENEEQRTYFIKVIKKIEDTSLKLTNFSIKAIETDGTATDLELDSEFNPDTYMYNCNVNKNTSKVEINAGTSKENSDISIEGNENLKSGENIVTITLKNKDKDDSVIYKLIINKEIVEEPEIKTDTNKTIYIIIAIAVIILIALIVIVKNIKGRSKH